MNLEDLEQAIRERLDALGPAPTSITELYSHSFADVIQAKALELDGVMSAKAVETS